MNQRVKDLISLGQPRIKANCFNAVQLYFGDEEATFCGPEEFVAYMQSKIYQLAHMEDEKNEDVFIIWSRTSDFLRVGSIDLNRLKKDRENYPFGLMIEHAFTLIDSNTVFSKA